MKSYFFILLFTIIFSSRAFCENTVTVSIIYNINVGGLENANITIRKNTPSDVNLYLIAMPFHSKPHIYENPKIIGVINRKEFSIALVTNLEVGSSIEVVVPIKRTLDKSGFVGIRQTPFGEVFISPPISSKNIKILNIMAQMIGGESVVSFNTLGSKLESGFTVLSNGAEMTLIEPKVIPLRKMLNSDTFQTIFRKPQSTIEEAISIALAPLFGAVIALLFFFASPGMLPTGPASNILIGITVVLAIGIVGTRWYFLNQSKGSFVEAVTYTIVAMLYFVGLVSVWLLRRANNGEGQTSA